MILDQNRQKCVNYFSVGKVIFAKYKKRDFVS